MSIGEFAKRSRLSPKALRLYDELGLLPPARVDDANGYRFHEESQLERADLVAALRQIGMPLTEIKAVLELPTQIAVDRIREFWAEAESEHTARRALTSYLVGRLNGKRSVMYEVTTRDIPARSVLCLKRNVTGSAQAWALGKDFVALLREHRLPRIEGRAGATFCIYWTQVSEDSDGPIEWCRPVPGDRAAELAEQIPELSLRTEQAHREAVVDLGAGGQTSATQWQLAAESLHAWATEHHARQLDLGVRATFLASQPVTETIAPETDFAVPFTGADD
jgi:DNA-binding transcriptional MerR regulator